MTCPECQANEPMDLGAVWDDPNLGYAFNLHLCGECGHVTKENVWEEKGLIQIPLKTLTKPDRKLAECQMSRRIEGYWAVKGDADCPWPFPEDNEEPWEGQGSFLHKLKVVEAYISSNFVQGAEERRYRGYSGCRICGERNGSTEFVTKHWRWPAGFRHYVETHNVEPSPEFERFILRSHERLESGKPMLVGRHFMEEIASKMAKDIEEAEDEAFLAYAEGRVAEFKKTEFSVIDCELCGTKHSGPWSCPRTPK